MKSQAWWKWFLHPFGWDTWFFRCLFVWEGLLDLWLPNWLIFDNLSQSGYSVKTFQRIYHSVKMTARWEPDLLSSKTSCLCSWWGSNVQKHYMGRLECGESVTFTIWHCLAKSCLWNPVFTFPISLPLALMQGKSSCYQEGKRKEEGRGASRAGGMTVSYIAHCELAINPGCRNYWNGEIVIS